MTNYWKKPDARKTALDAFSAQFFLITMGTGALAATLQTLPYQFRGLGIISIVIWLFDVILFAAFVAIFIAKWISSPTALYRHFRTEPEKTFYISSFAITTSTLLNMFALVLGPTWKGWDVAAMVLYYVNVVFALVCTVLPFMIAFREEEVTFENMPPTALFPVTAILSSAASGSIVVHNSSLSVRASLPIVILSIWLTGLAFVLGVIIISNFTSRLFFHSTLPPKKTMGSFVPVAAMSNVAYSCSSLTRLLGPERNLLAAYGQGYVANETVGLAAYGAGVMGALAIAGFASWWMLLGMVIAIRDAPKAPFTVNFWSAIYPWAIFSLALSQLAQDFDSPAFRTLCTIFTCLVLVTWLYCMAQTIPRIINGELLIACEEESREELDKWEERQRLNSRDEEQRSPSEDHSRAATAKGGSRLPKRS